MTALLSIIVFALIVLIILAGIGIFNLRCICNYSDFIHSKQCYLEGILNSVKSVASICLANDLLDRGFTVRYKVQPEIVYEDIEYRNAMLKDIINVNVLIIDDVNLSELSGNGREMLFYVLEARIKAKRPTIITSNITKEGIRHPSNANDKRICQRLGDEQYFYIVEDSSHNYREKG